MNGRLFPALDRLLALGCVLALGAGTAAAALSAFAGQVLPALAAGLVAAIAIVILVAAGWLDGLLLVLLSIPLPALIAAGDLRIAVAAPITALVLAAWLLQMRREPRAPSRLAWPRRATAVWFLAFALATAFASSPLVSLRELLNLVVLLGFFLLLLDRLHAPAETQRMLRAFVFLGALCGALALLEMTGFIPSAFPRWGTPFNRAALGFGQPNGLGLFQAVVLPLAVHGVRTRRGSAHLLSLLALTLIAGGLFATFSRGSWLAVVFGASALLFVGDARLFGRFLLGTILLGFAFDMLSGGMLRDTALRTLTDWVVEQRAALVLAGILMFFAYPILGVGPGGFAAQLPTFGAQIPELWDYLPTPHNAYVQVAAEAGVIGTIAYLAFLVVCLLHLVRSANAVRTSNDATELSLRRTLLWSFATACAAGLVIWPYAHGTGQAVLLLLAAGLTREGP